MRGIGLCYVAAVLAAQAIPAAAQSLTQIYTFAATGDGQYPTGNLTLLNNALFGTTYAGGAAGLGTVFRLAIGSGQESLLYSFTGSSDGAAPASGLVAGKRALYGTTTQGGAAGAGTVFSIDPVTGAFKTLSNFAGGADGTSPNGLFYIGGNLYGTTFQGGASGFGSLFKINIPRNTRTTLHSFGGGADGGFPLAGVIYVKGKLYGTTSTFGANGNGTLFSYDLATNAEATVHSFDNADDGAPGAGPLTYGAGVLFGTTAGSGSSGMGEPCDQSCGAVYSVDPAAGTERVIYRFQGAPTDGANPAAALTYVHGTLYGTTYDGGGWWCNGIGRGCGTVFAIDVRTGLEDQLVTFDGNNSWDAPESALINENGVLYGTVSGSETQTGCFFGCGGIFALTP